METLYRKVKCSERLPDNGGEDVFIYVTAWDVLEVGSYLNEWIVVGYNNPEVESWLEELQPQEQATVDEINELIQPHAITLEHGEKAAQAIHELVYGEKGGEG